MAMTEFEVALAVVVWIARELQIGTGTGRRSSSADSCHVANARECGCCPAGWRGQFASKSVGEVPGRACSIASGTRASVLGTMLSTRVTGGWTRPGARRRMWMWMCMCMWMDPPSEKPARDSRPPSACRAAWSILPDTTAEPFPEAPAAGKWPTPIGALLDTITNFSLWETCILMISSRVVHPREKQARSLCWSVGIWAVPVNGICFGHGSPDAPAPSRSNDRTGTNYPGSNRPMGSPAFDPGIHRPFD
jgi:hypothetical protein